MSSETDSKYKVPRLYYTHFVHTCIIYIDNYKAACCNRGNYDKNRSPRTLLYTNDSFKNERPDLVAALCMYISILLDYY